MGDYHRRLVMPTMQKAGSAQGPTADFYMLANNVEAVTRFIDAQSKAQRAGASVTRNELYQGYKTGLHVIRA